MRSRTGRSLESRFTELLSGRHLVAIHGLGGRGVSAGGNHRRRTAIRRPPSGSARSRRRSRYGVLRHADAGYDIAIEQAERSGSQRRCRGSALLAPFARSVDFRWPPIMYRHIEVSRRSALAAHLHRLSEPPRYRRLKITDDEILSAVEASLASQGRGER